MTGMSSGMETGSQTYFECVDFLNREAELLDDNRIREWFDEMIDQSIDYRVPIRVTRSREEGPGFSFQGWHMFEDFGSLEARVERLETEYAWAEDPPSRTRRLVSNIRVKAGEAEEEIEVKSNFLIYRGRYDSPDYSLIPGEREDVLLRQNGTLKLRKRMVLFDQATLGTHNLAIFF
jgi:3-phenylpropionate/cinnamic acid dioxygenase small subunit